MYQKHFSNQKIANNHHLQLISNNLSFKKQIDHSKQSCTSNSIEF